MSCNDRETVEQIRGERDEASLGQTS